MKKKLLFFVLMLDALTGAAQQDIPVIETLDLAAAPAGQVSRYWLHMISNGLSQPVLVPVMVAKGVNPGPVLGLVAAIHGNELNGIPIIQQLFQQIDPKQLNGTVVAVPGLNAAGILNEDRLFNDQEDLNRRFPGKENGDVSQQYVWRIFDKLVRHTDLLIDLHTASFGRVNTMYVRADMDSDTLAAMARLQGADIIVNNPGIPSAGAGSGDLTLRAFAASRGIPGITVEYGDPQVYQPDMTARGLRGIQRTMAYLKMTQNPVAEPEKEAILCKKSYWLYTDEGGLLDVTVALGQSVARGDVIGILRNPFGDVIRTYQAPESGVVIGKSSNPVNQSGGRILHLGILK